MKTASLIAGLSLAFTVAAHAERTWIGNVTIVSPERIDRVEKGGVLIDNGRIASVERGDVKAPADARVIDGGGRFLVPGLIDSHVHLALFPGTLDTDSLDPAMVRAYFAQLPRSYLYYGYTSLVDLIVFDKPVLDDFRKAPLHPDLYDCGEAVPMANGYPMVILPPERSYKAFPNFLFDPAHPVPIPPDAKPADHTPEAAVARVKASGAICLKTFIEPGIGKDHELPTPTAEMLTRLRKAATEAGLVMVVHANRFDTQRMAMDAGVDVIAHGMWHWGELDRAKEVPPEIASFLDRVAKSGVGYQPTMRVIYGESVYFDPKYLDDPDMYKVVPASLIAWFKTPQGGQFMKQASPPGASAAAMTDMYMNGLLRRDRLVTAYLDRKGADLIFGTDTPSAPTYGNLPGLNGYLEMKEWRAAGVPLAHIFRAATLDNAKRFKLDKDVGSIEPGKAANLLLLEKSPLESVDAYDSIVTVWIRGNPVAREALSASR